MNVPPPAVSLLTERLVELGWISDLFVAGSVATGDYVPGVSDIDLVAIVAGSVDAARVQSLGDLHRGLDLGAARGCDLGCVYVAEHSLANGSELHPTWTHGRLVRRSLSGVTRAELGRFGFALLGRHPQDVLPPITADGIREATREELCGYWSRAVRRPTMWFGPSFTDLSLTSMARGRHALQAGDLITKTEAIERVDAPDWLVEQIRSRRRGEAVASPRLRMAWIAWRDACRTTKVARILHSPGH